MLNILLIHLSCVLSSIFLSYSNHLIHVGNQLTAFYMVQTLALCAIKGNEKSAKMSGNKSWTKASQRINEILHDY